MHRFKDLLLRDKVVAAVPSLLYGLLSQTLVKLIYICKTRRLFWHLWATQAA